MASLNLDEFRKLSREDAFKAAGQFAGVQPDIFVGLWGAESAKGERMLSKAGAEGHFQAMPGERAKWEKPDRLGRKINPYDFHEGLFLAAHQLKENMGGFGNVDDALRAYNGGWNKATWGNAETSAYVGSVRKWAGLAPSTPADLVAYSGSAVKHPGDSFEEMLDKQAPTGQATPSTVAPPPEAVSKLSQMAQAIQAAGAPANTPSGPGKGPAEAQAEYKAFLAKEEKDDIGIIEAARSLMPSSSFLFAGALEATINGMFAPVPGYTPPDEELQGFTIDQQNDLRESSNSPAEFNARKNQLLDRADDLRRIGQRHWSFGLAAGVLGGAPEAIVTGRAATLAFKAAGIGSVVLAEKGQRGAAIASQVAEGAVANVITTAGLDALGETKNWDDYALDAVLGGLLNLHPTGIKDPIRKAADEIVQDQGERVAKALDEVGPSASPEVVQQAVQAAETATLRETTHTGAIAGDRRLLNPDVYDIEKFADEAIPAPDVQVKQVAEPSGPSAPQTRTIKQALEEVLTSPAMTTAAVGTREARVTIGYLLKNLPEQVQARMVMFGQSSPFYRATDQTVRTTGESPGTLKADTFDAQLLIHEVTHAATAHVINAVSESIVSPGTVKLAIPGDAKEAVLRLAGLHQELRSHLDATGARDTGRRFGHDYAAQDLHEFVAQVMSDRETRETLLKMPGKKFDAPNMLQAFINSVLDILGFDRKSADTALAEAMKHIDTVIKHGGGEHANHITAAQRATMYGPKNMQASSAAISRQSDPTLVKHGLDLMPLHSAAERAEQAAVLELYKRADEYPQIDKARVSKMTNAIGLGSASQTMLLSPNPVMRMLAAELIENPAGAAGRRATAAIGKFLFERKFVGNVHNEVLSAYKAWSAGQGGTLARLKDDFSTGKMWQRFGVQVAEEIEGRRVPGGLRTNNPQVKAAADKMEAAYERMRTAQVEHKTLGWAALPETSVGYMPHKLSPGKVRNMTLGQKRALHQALTDQMITIDGFDLSFADKLATSYIDRIHRRALGGHDTAVNLRQPGAADVIEDALQAMGMSRDEVLMTMKKFRNGSASHTKKRMDLDLLRVYGDGAEKFRMLDFFETDPLQLLKSQAQRVSGEVALTRHGIFGKPGLTLARRAFDFGNDAEKVSACELEAFDQMGAELLGEPFGKHQSKWLDRAMMLTSLVRLGGMGFTQAGEYINAATAVGVSGAMKSVSGFGRLRAEAVALSRGQKVDNAILNSLETYGAEFGAEAYKMVFPFDNPTLEHQLYGRDTTTMADRLLRGGVAMQGMLSGWRAIHAAQQRGMAEQIVHKAARFLRDGGNDAALDDIGLHQDVRTKLLKDLPNIAKFDSSGRLVEFDITKATDTQAAEEFVQAVHRGAAQIIQGTFIGEKGAWAHDGFLKLLTQFRTFGITAAEKQWTRQTANHGVTTTVAMLMGSMAFAAPIHIARVLAASVGMPEQEREKYLERRLAPIEIARATMNYVALTGLSGDVLDQLSNVVGATQLTGGGRTGNTNEKSITSIVPAAGVAEDLYRAVQNSKDGTDIEPLVRALPGAKLPYLAPVLNSLGD